MNDFLIHPSAFVDEPCKIGVGVKIWHCSHIMANCEIGDNCNIGQNVVIGSYVVIGNNVKIQNNVSVYEGVVCEDDVFLGPSMVFTNVINPRSSVSRKHEFKKTLVRRGATIGANATIICGNEIGEFAFVGAGSVVTKNILPYALVIGNPAKQIGWISEHGNRLFFNENGIAVCEETGAKYQLQNVSVKKIEEGNG